MGNLVTNDAGCNHQIKSVIAMAKTSLNKMIPFLSSGINEKNKKKNTYNFYLVIEVPDHVYVSG